MKLSVLLKKIYLNQAKKILQAKIKVLFCSCVKKIVVNDAVILKHKCKFIDEELKKNFS